MHGFCCPACNPFHISYKISNFGRSPCRRKCSFFSPQSIIQYYWHYYYYYWHYYYYYWHCYYYGTITTITGTCNDKNKYCNVEFILIYCPTLINAHSQLLYQLFLQHHPLPLPSDVAIICHWILNLPSTTSTK